MHPITTPPGGAARRRRLLAAAVATIATAGLALGVVDSPAAAAPAPLPAAIPGDPYSPMVAATAGAALAARDVYAMAGDPAALRTYEDKLGEAAAAVAVEFATDPAVVSNAWAQTDLAGQTAVLAALTQLGNDYQYASSDPAVGFDCSGLTAYAWRRAGVDLPTQSGAQMDVAPAADAALAGDLVQYPGHVMLYLGFDEAIVHAANEATNVELSQLPSRDLNWADPNG